MNITELEVEERTASSIIGSGDFFFNISSK